MLSAERARLIAGLSPLIRVLIADRDLAELEDEEIAELAKLDVIPPARCGPNLLHFRNALREHRALS